MNTTCQMSYCEWIGDVDELFYHFETHHQHYIKEIKKDILFEFNFEEIFKPEPHLLCTSNGIYWLKSKEEVDGFKYDIHHVGNSKVEKYFIKFGIFAETGITQICGPYQTKPIGFENYDFDLAYRTLYLLQRMSPKIKIYFTENYEDNEDNEDEKYIGISPDDIDWKDPESITMNAELLEKFTCPICHEFIRKDVRFCENQHYLCGTCLNSLIEQNKAICPLCRGSFQFDCSSDKIETLLKLLEFPEDGSVEMSSADSQVDEEFDDDMKFIEISLDDINGEITYEVHGDTENNVIEIEINSVADLLNLRSTINALFGSNSN